jgi:periplasmic divalent cation tolerance protein
MSAARFVYITAESRDEAVAIGRALVQERLAACANVIDPVTSIYWWEGRCRKTPKWCWFSRPKPTW